MHARSGTCGPTSVEGMSQDWTDTANQLPDFGQRACFGEERGELVIVESSNILKINGLAGRIFWLGPLRVS